MGRTVAELMSSNISNAITNVRTWADLAINVKSFGAVGDGVADDTEAIQSAINYAISIGKREVWFPAGTYIYTTLSDTDDIVFVGDGVTLVGDTVVPLESIAQLADIALNVKSFGAISGGETDNTNAINEALQAAAGGVLLIPEGDFYFTGTLNIPANTTLRGTGYGSRLHPYTTTEKPIVIDGVENVTIRDLLIKGRGPSVINIEGGSSHILIEGVQFEREDESTPALNQCVRLFDCSFVTVSHCTFRNVKYQIIQELFYASSDCKVINNTSENCYLDFVLLNCERRAPSRNWLISNNTVKNVGMFNEDGTPVTSKQTECRFVGATLVDNLIIANNNVEGIAGDAAVHLERPGRVIINGNTFKDVHGNFVSIIPTTNLFGDTGADAPLDGAYNAIEMSITDNVFLITDSPLTGDSGRIIACASVSNFSSAVIKNNIFAFYEPTVVDEEANTWTGYPKPPSTRYGTAIRKTNCFRNWIIEANRFMYLETAIDLDSSIGGSAPTFNAASSINRNEFYACTKGINTGSNEQLLECLANTFRECVTPWTFTTMPVKMGGNSYIDSDVTGLTKLNQYYDQDLYSQGSGTDDPRHGVTVTQGVDTELCLIPPRVSGIMSIVIERSGAANNNAREVLAVSSRYGDFEYLQLARHTNGSSLPTFTLSGSGTDPLTISITLSGGTAGDYIVYVDFQGSAS